MTTWLIRLSNRRSWPQWLILAALAGFTYLAVSGLVYGYNGFPLDDAWIHQTYARNLGQHGQFAFTLGQASTGSTAPLWTLLLSLGYVLGIPYTWWTHGLGILLLALSGFSMAQLGRHLFPARLWLGPLIGLALIFEWHLVWAAMSGMETILFVWLSIFILERYAAGRANLTRQTLFSLGILGGLLALVRPEGLGLVGLIGLELGWTTRQTFGQTTTPPRSGLGSIILGRWLLVGIGFILPVLPYLLFNYSTTGLLLPNTFYAKQQEYGLWISEQFQTPGAMLAFRVQVYWVPFIGAAVLLLPGLLKAISAIWRQQNRLLGLMLIWWLSYASLYFVRLPVTYQHGRYQMPVIPWIVLLGVWGTTLLLKPNHRQLWPRVLSRALLLALVLGHGLFIVLGSQAYARDTRIIETEMVLTAEWLHENIPQGTLIAAHDIGAIGYFAQHPLIDLAGLISPEVIPFIRDEIALQNYATQTGAKYLVTFPNWYPAMTKQLPLVYSTKSPWAVEAGGDNMAVFALDPSESKP